jgi:uncharacterized protein involved in outer membrane biogenesis
MSKAPVTGLRRQDRRQDAIAKLTSGRQTEPAGRASSNWKRVSILLICGLATLVVIIAAALMTPALQQRAIVALASASTARAVRFGGGLRVHAQKDGIEVIFAGLHLGQPAWGPPGDMVVVRRGRARVALLPLLTGHVVIRELELDGPDIRLVRTLDGKANWRLGPMPRQSGPLSFPAARRIAFHDGRLSLSEEQRHLQLSGNFSTNPDGTLVLQAQGAARDEPVRVMFLGATLAGTSKDRPYPFRADIAGTNKIKLTGAMEGGLDWSHLRAQAWVEGPDLARLYGLTGLLAPNTPPYRLSGALEQRGERLSIRKMTGKIGSTDISGTVDLDKKDGSRQLTAALESKVLDLADLRAIVGGGAGGGGRALPAGPLQSDRLQGVQGKVHYRALAVRRSVTGARSASAEVAIKNGVVSIAPAILNLTRGHIEANVVLDASGATPRTRVDVQAVDVQLQDLRTPSGKALPASGLLQGRLRLDGRGSSLRAAAAAANGELILAVSRGTLDRTVADLIGGDLGATIVSFFSRDQSRTELYCAGAALDVKEGLVTSRRLVVDTGVATARGSGSVDLHNESLSLRFDGRSKQRMLAKAMPTVVIDGTLSHPRLRLNPVAVKLQVTASVLDKVVTPVAKALGVAPRAGPVAGGCG